MNLKYIDIHSHLNAPEFEKDLDDVVSRMEESNTGTIVVGVDKETSRRAIEIAEKYENIWACVGFHPTDYKEVYDEIFLEGLISNPKVVAIGECGLDYFHQKDKSDRKSQRELFEKQIDLAATKRLPLMLHVRDAHEDALEILFSKKKEHGETLRGNSHFFTSTLDIAKKYFELGFTISISGVATFSSVLDEVIKKSPMESLLIETDSPYASPEPFRGKRNEPSNVSQIALKIAQIKGLLAEEVSRELLNNSISRFHLRA